VNGSEVGEREEVLRQSIERDEAELRDAVGELATAVKSEFTLGAHIAAHPVLSLLGGFALGLWLGRRE